jgi:hypothetical protein
MNKLPSLQDVQDATRQLKARIAEQNQYFDIAWDKYRDTAVTILGLDKYTKAQQFDCIAECAYILEHKQMPEWAYLIESFEISSDGNLLFIHRDKDAKH